MQLFSSVLAVVASIFVMVSAEEHKKVQSNHLSSSNASSCASKSLTSKRKINFGIASQLPLDVLKQFTKDLINFDGSGVGVAELDYRTPFLKIRY